MGRELEEGIFCPTASKSREVPCAANRGKRGLKVSAWAGPANTRGPDGAGRTPGPRSQPATPWAPLHSCSHLNLDPLLPTPAPMALRLPGPDAESLRTDVQEHQNRAFRGGLVARGLARAFHPGPDPRGPGSSPAWALCTGLLLPLSVWLPLSVSVSLCLLRSLY